MDRQATISISLEEGSFDVRRFVATERFSEPYNIVVEGYSTAEIDFLPNLGKAVSLDVSEAGVHVRYFHGLLTEAALFKADGEGSHYRLTLRPWLYLLDQNRDYRIFQQKTVVEIAKAVFSAAGVSDVRYDTLTGAYKAREYCVQYKESDYAFLSRLFEDEGIYYYFEHGASAHKLILCDSPSAHKAANEVEMLPVAPVQGGQTFIPDSMGEWREEISARAAVVTLGSYNFKTPKVALLVETPAALDHPHDDLEVYDYLGDYDDKAAGEARGKVRLDGQRADRRVFHGEGDSTGLACGASLEISRSTISRYNRKYVLVGVIHRVDVEGSRSGGVSAPSTVTVEAIPNDVVYRPALKTPKPYARGPETAVVAGPQGEVIYVDDFGRVKVKFFWDRATDDPGNNSCWLRVADSSAGNTLGHIVLPRIGQEVIVDFLDGNPDRPIITGRVYNGDNMPPYVLPANKTRSTWKSQTIGEAGSYSGAEKPPSGVGYNEIRFEDKGGSEEVYVRAQRDRVTDVYLDDKLTVQRDRIDRVGRNRTVNVLANETLTVETGDEARTVSKGKRTTAIKMDDALTVQDGNLTTTVEKGDMSTEVSMGNAKTKVSMGDYDVKVDLGKVTIEAMQSITLKVGTNTVVIDQTGVTIKGMMVKSEATMTHETKGLMVQSQGSAMSILKGGIVMIN